jgi:DNA-3-methyladenine glycosylase I
MVNVIFYNYHILGGAILKLNELERPYISDHDFFEKMMAVVFGSGIKKTVVEKKWECIQSHFTDFWKVAEYDEQKLLEIYNDPNMLRNPHKINAIVYNANHMIEIFSVYGSMDEFIRSYELANFEYSEWIMANDLMSRFKYFGEVTSLRFIESVFGMSC